MFYERLKKLCFERGISVSKMAVDLKISTTTVTGWKRGARPQPAQVKKIVEYFKISTDELLYVTPAAAVSPTDLQDDNAADLMELIKSQQDAIRNLSESSKSLAKSTENLSESNKNLSEYLSKSAVHKNHR
jgi:transcriptional regulator with XRE-family HTH domain